MKIKNFIYFFVSLILLTNSSSLFCMAHNPLEDLKNNPKIQEYLSIIQNNFGLSPKLNDSDLNKSYRKITSQYHPDKYPTDTTPEDIREKANAVFQFLNNAKDFITTYKEVFLFPTPNFITAYNNYLNNTASQDELKILNPLIHILKPVIETDSILEDARKMPFYINAIQQYQGKKAEEELHKKQEEQQRIKEAEEQRLKQEQEQKLRELKLQRQIKLEKEKERKRREAEIRKKAQERIEKEAQERLAQQLRQEEELRKKQEEQRLKSEKEAEERKQMEQEIQANLKRAIEEEKAEKQRLEEEEKNMLAAAREQRLRMEQEERLKKELPLNSFFVTTKIKSSRFTTIKGWLQINDQKDKVLISLNENATAPQIIDNKPNFNFINELDYNLANEYDGLYLFEKDFNSKPVICRPLKNDGTPADWQFAFSPKHKKYLGFFNNKLQENRPFDSNKVSLKGIPQAWLDYWRSLQTSSSSQTSLSSSSVQQPKTIKAGDFWTYAQKQQIDPGTFILNTIFGLEDTYKASKHSKKPGAKIILNTSTNDWSTFQANPSLNGATFVIASSPNFLEGAINNTFKKTSNANKAMEALCSEHAVQGESASLVTPWSTKQRFDDFQKPVKKSDSRAFDPLLETGLMNTLMVGIHTHVPVLGKLTDTLHGKANPENVDLQLLPNPNAQIINQIFVSAVDRNPAHQNPIKDLIIQTNNTTLGSDENSKNIIIYMTKGAILAAILNNSKTIVIPFLGAGAFKNEAQWTIDAITESINLIKDNGLTVIINDFANNPDRKKINSLQKIANDNGIPFEQTSW